MLEANGESPSRVNFQQLQIAIESAGVRFSIGEPEEMRKLNELVGREPEVMDPSEAGSITHLKGYGIHLMVNESLSEEAQFEAAAHLIGHFVLGHAAVPEGMVYTIWRARVDNNGQPNCLDHHFYNEAVMQQEQAAHDWVNRFFRGS